MILLNLGDYVSVINVDKVKRAWNMGWNKGCVAEDLLLSFWLTCETLVGPWKCMCSKPTCFFFLWARKCTKFSLGPSKPHFHKIPPKKIPSSGLGHVRYGWDKITKPWAWSCLDYFADRSLSEPLQEFGPQQFLIALLNKGDKNEMNFYQAHKLSGQQHLNSIFISLHLNFPINLSKSQYRTYKWLRLFTTSLLGRFQTNSFHGQS